MGVVSFNEHDVLPAFNELFVVVGSELLHKGLLVVKISIDVFFFACSGRVAETELFHIIGHRTSAERKLGVASAAAFASAASPKASTEVSPPKELSKRKQAAIRSSKAR